MIVCSFGNGCNFAVPSILQNFSNRVLKFGLCPGAMVVKYPVPWTEKGQGNNIMLKRWPSCKKRTQYAFNRSKAKERKFIAKGQATMLKHVLEFFFNTGKE